MTKEKNYFEKLNSINVKEKIKKRGNYNYLSWAWAWEELKKVFPKSTYKVYEKEDGRIYWDDGKTAWVKTGVTVNEIEHIEYLPIMDFKNKSITINNITSFNVNKSIQRSLTKAVARHGLGLYLYAGEDLPEEKKPTNQEIADKEKLEKIYGIIKQEFMDTNTTEDIEKIKEKYKKDLAWIKKIDVTKTNELGRVIKNKIAEIKEEPKNFIDDEIPNFNNKKTEVA